MDKNSLQSRLAQEGVNLNKKQTDGALNALTQAIKDDLDSTGTCRVYGLGTFEVKNIGAHTARNPRTGEPVQVPAKKKVVFRAAKGLKE
jgi:nucleoid DNA-binding protein